MSSNTAVRGRYAPSPTGELHLGNVRTALVAWLSTRAAGGTFVLRVEDLDPPRVLAGAEARALEDLRWLGLDWDEGPDVGGPFGPYRQSERLPLFAAALETLRTAERVYGCSCSRAELKQLASAPHGEDGPIYPGTCRVHALAIQTPALVPGSRQPAVRFTAAPGTWCFQDRLAGRVCQDVEREVGDFVIRRADGLFAYQLAVVVDDGLMGITEVTRGADLVGSTARQMQLQAALGLPTPAYAHVPLVVDGAGQRLAKRDRATSIRALRESGVTPQALMGWLGWSLGLQATSTPIAAGDLIAAFDWAHVPQLPWECSDRTMELITGERRQA